jgi:thiazole synthase
VKLTIAGRQFNSRLLLGTALYPTLEIMQQAVTIAQAEIITVSLRRQAADPKAGETFWNHIKTLGCQVLPNTAGCQTAPEAITTALMAREIFNTHLIKLELVGDNYTLQPNPFELVTACAELIAQGFEVLPYSTDDLVVCQKLVDLGCKVIMPGAAPIGSGQGLLNMFALRTLRQRLPNTTLIVDAGIGSPSHAAQVMELGFDGVLLNSAVALAIDPIKMAKAFSLAITSGRLAYEAGLMPQRDFASPTTPVVGMPFIKEKNPA